MAGEAISAVFAAVHLQSRDGGLGLAHGVLRAEVLAAVPAVLGGVVARVALALARRLVARAVAVAVHLVAQVLGLAELAGPGLDAGALGGAGAAVARSPVLAGIRRAGVGAHALPVQLPAGLPCLALDVLAQIHVHGECLGVRAPVGVGHLDGNVVGAARQGGRELVGRPAHCRQR